jgi:hypothetical protein
MAVDYRLSNAAADAMAVALIAAIDAGTAAILEIYDGTQINPAAAITTQTKLVVFTFPATFGTSSNGVITIDCDPDISATAETFVGTKTASWGRLLTQAGGTVIMTGNVGTSGAAINLSSVSLVDGQACTLTSGTITVPTGQV